MSSLLQTDAHTFMRYHLHTNTGKCALDANKLKDAQNAGPLYAAPLLWWPSVVYPLRLRQKQDPTGPAPQKIARWDPMRPMNRVLLQP